MQAVWKQTRARLESPRVVGASYTSLSVGRTSGGGGLYLAYVWSISGSRGSLLPFVGLLMLNPNFAQIHGQDVWSSL
jgi:hypothetical protein